MPQRPRAGFGVVVGVPSEPDRAGADDWGAECPVDECLADALGGGPEAPLEEDPEFYSGVAAGVDHAVGLFEGDGDGLLAQDVQTLSGGGEDARFVDRMRGADGHRVEAAGEHFLHVAVGPGDSVVRCECGRPFAVDVTAGDQLNLGDAFEGRRVVDCDFSATDDAYTEFSLRHVSSPARSCFPQRTVRRIGRR